MCHLKRRKKRVDRSTIERTHAKLTSHTFLNYTTNTTDVHKFAFLESFERASLAFVRVRRRSQVMGYQRERPGALGEGARGQVLRGGLFRSGYVLYRRERREVEVLYSSQI